MDIDGFWKAHAAAMALDPYDVYLIDIRGPKPGDETPTDADLTAATETVISIEQELALIPGLLDAIDDASSSLNYFYDADYASQPGDPALRQGYAPAILSAYERAVEHLSAVRSSLNAQAQVLQALLSAWISARAKIEHDLGWQSYVQERFGIDPASVPRDVKCVVPIQEPETCN